MFQPPRRARSTIPRKFQSTTWQVRMIFSILTSLCIVMYICLGARIGSIHTTQHAQTRDNAVAILMDTSLSMSATDITPNRFTHMQAIVSWLVMTYPAEYIGIPFGAIPLLRTPQSRDGLWIRTVLGDDTLWSYHLALEYMGSAPGNAVWFAIGELEKSNATKRTIVLLGDWNINTGYNRETFLPLLRTQDITLLVCSIGKPWYIIGTRFDDAPVMSEVDTTPLTPFLAGAVGKQQLCNTIPEALQFLWSYLDDRQQTWRQTATRERRASIRENKKTRALIMLCVLYQCFVASYALMAYRTPHRPSTKKYTTR